jgi:hypothetical protein
MQPGSFYLAVLHFTALSVGSSPLALTINFAGDALGNSLTPTAVSNSSINIGTTIPEPALSLLVGMGLAGILFLRRRFAS